MESNLELNKSIEITLETTNASTELTKDSSKWKILIKNSLKKEKLLVFLIFAVILSFILGTTLNSKINSLDPITKTNLLLIIGFPGEIFLRSLKMVILPLIFSSLVTGMAALDKNSAGKISIIGIIYYFITTFTAVILGIILVVSIKPGSKLGATVDQGASKDVRTIDVILDIVRNIFPDNIITATFQQTKTENYRVYSYSQETESFPEKWTSWDESTKQNYKNLNKVVSVDDTSKTLVKNVSSYVIYPNKPSNTNGMNMIGIISFSIVFGVLLGRLGNQGRELLACLNSISEIMTVMVDLIMLISPIGVASLIINEFWMMTDVSAAFSSLALYIVTVILGLFIHLMVTLNLLYFLVTRKNPFVYLRNLSRACITAFGTASSAATIPVTLSCLERQNKIRPKVARFMVPVGATINMDGTALYEAVAAIFIAQSTNVSLSFGHICLTSITATIASIGAAGVPQGGLVTIVMVLQVLGLPSESLGLILSVDWLLDRFRTSVNVIGDSYGAGIVDHLVASYLEH